MFLGKHLWTMAAGLLSIMMVADSALACGGFGDYGYRELPVAKRPPKPQGKPFKSAKLLADAQSEREEATEAAAFARTILRAAGRNRKIATIDGKPATATRQLQLARTLLEELAARDPDNASLATDLGEMLTRSPHDADRTRGFNILAKLHAQGTLTTAQGYRALAKMWRHSGDVDKASVALSQCRVLSTRAGQCGPAMTMARHTSAQHTVAQPMSLPKPDAA